MSQRPPEHLIDMMHPLKPPITAENPTNRRQHGPTHHRSNVQNTSASFRGGSRMPRTHAHSRLRIRTRRPRTQRQTYGNNRENRPQNHAKMGKRMVGMLCGALDRANAHKNGKRAQVFEAPRVRVFCAVSERILRSDAVNTAEFFPPAKRFCRSVRNCGSRRRRRAEERRWTSRRCRVWICRL